jgi:hypothetical protein
MQAEGPISPPAHDPFVVVERLSTQDQGRIVRLVESLNRAPDEVRRSAQLTLRCLLARESMTQGECLEALDRVLADIEREINAPKLLRPRAGSPPGALQGTISAG